MLIVRVYLFFFEIKIEMHLRQTILICIYLILD